MMKKSMKSLLLIYFIFELLLSHSQYVSWEEDYLSLPLALLFFAFFQSKLNWRGVIISLLSD